MAKSRGNDPRATKIEAHCAGLLCSCHLMFKNSYRIGPNRD